MRYKFKIYWAITVFTLGIIAAVGANITVPATANLESRAEVGHTNTIFDQNGNMISKMSRKIYVGDELINAKGQHFRVIKVNGNKATAKLIGMNKEYLSWRDYFTNLDQVPVTTNKDKKQPVAIYHTHSAESYVPTDGAAFHAYSGGIFKVGQVFANELEQQGVTVVLNDARHDPHDNMAYVRSRRTVTELLQQNPVAMFDVHRDGIPDPNFFYDTVSGEDVARVRFIIGRQNPNMAANKDFAKRLMAYSNQKHPDIVREIFMANGTYNQDLLPTNILIEAGTYTNRREKAEDGIALLADAVPVVVGLGPAAVDSPEAGVSGWQVAGGLLAAALIGGALFLLISTGSVRRSGEKIRGLGKEFGDLWAPLRKKKVTSKDNSDETSNK